MRSHQTRVNSRRDGSIIVSPAQKYIWMGWVVGSSTINYFNLISQMRDAIELVVGWFAIS